MRNVFLAIVLLTSCILADTTIVIQFKDVTKDVLKEKCYYWVANNFRTPTKVVSYVSEDVLMVRPVMTVLNRVSPQMCYNGIINYKILFEFKDYKCKITINEFIHTSTGNSTCSLDGIFFEQPKYRTGQKITNYYQSLAIKESEDIITSYTNCISTQQDNDW